MEITNVLLKSEVDQTYIASRSNNPKLLDILANSDSELVRMTVLANPSVSTSTILRKIDDETPAVWQRASALLEKRGA